jgi:SAM-dependent methyltransferase
MTAQLGSLREPAVRVVCPRCRGILDWQCLEPSCGSCGSRYPRVDGFTDLIVGERYDDDTREESVTDEEITNRDTVDRYWIPLFGRLWPEGHRERKILSLGCGVGTDVERLVEAGFDAIGIDNGKRTRRWALRPCADRLILANGRHMPFEQGTFDLIFCGCVFPHVGVVGTTFQTTPDFLDQRLELAAEMARVLKPGGKIITCNPNRYFPFDVFHGHHAGAVRLRPTMPWDRLLLSRGDYLRMFRRFGLTRAVALPVENYWSLTNSRRSSRGRILAALASAVFILVSRVRIFRGSPLNPWLILMLEKGEPCL